MKKIYIAILNFNGWKDTIECLESVLKTDYPNFQIIVLDNDSTNNSLKFITNWANGVQDVLYSDNSQLKHLSQPPITKPLEYVVYNKSDALKGGEKNKEKLYKNPIIFIQSGENNGFASGNNIGIKYALAKNDFDYIWLLNNDTVVNKNTLSLFINNLGECGSVGIYGNVLEDYYHPSMSKTYGRYLNPYLGTSHSINNKINLDKINFISGASMLITRECIERVGLLPEDYFLYYEETDYCFKAKECGFKLKVITESVTYHKEGTSTSLGSKNIKMDLLFHSNRLKFSKKYLSYVFIVKLGILATSLKRFLNFEYTQGKNLLKLLSKSP